LVVAAADGPFVGSGCALVLIVCLTYYRGSYLWDGGEKVKIVKPTYAFSLEKNAKCPCNPRKHCYNISVRQKEPGRSPAQENQTMKLSNPQAKTTHYTFAFSAGDLNNANMAKLNPVIRLGRDGLMTIESALSPQGDDQVTVLTVDGDFFNWFGGDATPESLEEYRTYLQNDSDFQQHVTDQRIITE
jgi:hypothetical protein